MSNIFYTAFGNIVSIHTNCIKNHTMIEKMTDNEKLEGFVLSNINQSNKTEKNTIKKSNQNIKTEIKK